MVWPEAEFESWRRVPAAHILGPWCKLKPFIFFFFPFQEIKASRTCFTYQAFHLYWTLHMLLMEVSMPINWASEAESCWLFSLCRFALFTRNDSMLIEFPSSFWSTFRIPSRGKMTLYIYAVSIRSRLGLNMQVVRLDFLGKSWIFSYQACPLASVTEREFESSQLNPMVELYHPGPEYAQVLLEPIDRFIERKAFFHNNVFLDIPKHKSFSWLEFCTLS